MAKYKKRSDGRYCKQILVGYKPDGKRIMKTIYAKTIKELEEKEDEIRLDIRNGLILTRDDLTVGEWARSWLSAYKVNTSGNTYDMYEKNIRNHIIPHIGYIRLKQLKPIHIQNMINDIIDSGKVRTAIVSKLTIKQIISQAVEEGFISKNICNNLPAIKSETPEKRVLTNFELQCIERADFTEREQMFIDILYYTGLRKGEVLALDITDIKKDKKTLRVDQNLDMRNNIPELKDPKSKSGFREVPIPDILYDSLTHYVNNTKTFYLFTGKNGELITRSSYRRMWDSIMKKVKCAAGQILAESDITDNDLIINQAEELLDFTPHTFRHTYATNLYYAGVKVKRMQYLLGHSTLEMTLKIYTHLDKINLETDTTEQINNFFSQSKVSQTPKQERLLICQ